MSALRSIQIKRQLQTTGYEQSNRRTYRCSGSLECFPPRKDERGKGIVRIFEIANINSPVGRQIRATWLGVQVVRETACKVALFFYISAFCTPAALYRTEFSAVYRCIGRRAFAIHCPERRGIPRTDERSAHGDIIRSTFGKARFDVHHSSVSMLGTVSPSSNRLIHPGPKISRSSSSSTEVPSLSRMVLKLRRSDLR